MKDIDVDTVVPNVDISKTRLRNVLQTVDDNFKEYTQTAVVFINGPGVPDNGIGVDGNYYIDTLTGDLYNKASGIWLYLMNLQGPPGAGGVVSVNTKTGVVNLTTADIAGSEPVAVKDKLDVVVEAVTQVIKFGAGMTLTLDAAHAVSLVVDPVVVKEAGVTKTSRLQSLDFLSGAVVAQPTIGNVTVDVSAGSRPIVKQSGGGGTDRPSTIEFTTPLNYAFSAGVATITYAGGTPTPARCVGYFVDNAIVGAPNFVRPGFYVYIGSTWTFIDEIQASMVWQGYGAYTDIDDSPNDLKLNRIHALGFTGTQTIILPPNLNTNISTVSGQLRGQAPLVGFYLPAGLTINFAAGAGVSVYPYGNSSPLTPYAVAGPRFISFLALPLAYWEI